LLPRYPSQGERVRSLGLQNVVIPPGVVDGLNLVYWSDVVVSAGGSMNREAVVLGTPAYTVFGGRMAGVDTALLASGRMTELRSATDLEGLVIKKRRRNRFRPVPDSATHHVVAAILGSAAHF
jgi:predicted glycosyltransferase